MRFRHAGVAASLAGETERWREVCFEHTQPRLLAHDVIARRRRHSLALGELDLEHHHVAFAERHLRGSEIKLPHPYETLVVEPHCLVAMGEKALAPGLG